MANQSGFSEYKTNDFLKQEIQRYEKQLEDEKKKRSRFDSSIFSGFMSFATALFLYSIKDSETLLSPIFIWVRNQVVNNQWLIIAVFLAIIALSIILFLGYNLIFSKMRTLISRFRYLWMMRGTIRLDKLSPQNPDVIDHLFHHKVDDQISLAVSIFDNFEKGNSNTLYLYDSFRHLSNAVKVLSSDLMLPGSPFMKKLGDKEDSKYSLYRVQELFKASSDLIDKIKRKWVVQLKDADLKSEMESTEASLAIIEDSIGKLLDKRQNP